MPRPIPARNVGAFLAVLVGALVGLVVLAGCTSTTSGIGSVRRFPTAPFTPPGSVNPGGPISPVPSGAPSGAPPPACDPASCQQRLSASLNAPYGVTVWADDSGSTFVVLTNAGAPASFATFAGETPAQLSCVRRGESSNCVLVDQNGGSAAVAHLLREASGALVARAYVRASTTTMQAKDLNGDGWVDVAGLQKNSDGYYWQTWTSDGTQFRSTGCSAPPVDQPAPAPSTTLGAHCR